jgi:hypothetical protein
MRDESMKTHNFKYLVMAGAERPEANMNVELRSLDAKEPRVGRLGDVQ